MAIKVGKTVTTIGVHVAVASVVGYALTGSWAVGGLVAVVEPLVNIAAHHVHDKAWDKVLAAVGMAEAG